MPLFERRLELLHSPDDVLAWHLRPGAFRRLTPPWLDVELVEDALVEEGSRLVFRLPVGPARIRWVAEHRDVGPHGFRDVQVEGPFARWDHQHLVQPDRGGATLRDRISYTLPGGPLAQFGAPALEADLRRTFAWRHRRTARDLDLHRALETETPLRIVVRGRGPVAERVRLLALGGTHHLVAADPEDADVEISETPSGVRITRDDRIVDLSLPLLVDGSPSCRRLAARRIAGLVGDVDRSRPIPWLSVDDAAAAIIAIAVRPPADDQVTLAAPDAVPLWRLAAAPVAWFGDPDRPRRGESLDFASLPLRHPRIDTLLRDAVG